MAKKRSESSVRDVRTRKKEASTRVTYDSEALLRYFLQERSEPYRSERSRTKIDYSDIPELTEAQMKKAKHPRVGRPPLGAAAKKMISMKIDPILLEQLKERARLERKGYQTLIQEILERFIRS
ncbi:MAG: BrnA antitoxin family protein [Pseudomonadota bacterium]